MSYTIDMLTLGQKASFSKTITESDIYLFAGLTGDVNPAHINEAYASQTFFRGRIAHGMLSAGLISAVLGMQLPGPGTIYLEQNVRFLAPVRPGDTVTATVEVAELHPGNNTVLLRTICENQDGKQVLDGIAKVKAPLTCNPV